MASWKGIAMVFGAFLVHLTLGTLYTFGNMAPYIASYYQNYLKFDVTLTDLTWVYAAMIAAQGLLMTLGGILERRLGARITAFIGCAIMSSGVALTYFTINHDFIWVIITYGVMYGVGISLSYISLISCGMKWFPKQRGLVSGVVVAGFGLGALIFNPIQTEFLNPENALPNNKGYFYEESLLLRVPNVFLLLGGIYGIMQIIGCALASSPPVELAVPEMSPVLADKCDQLETFDNTGELGVNNNELQIQNISDTMKPRSYKPMQVLKTREFYLLWLTFFFNAQTANFVNSMYKIYGQTFIKDDLFLAIVGAIGAVFNAFGRIGWGFLVDAHSYKTCMRTMLTFALIVLLTMPATSLAGRYCFAVWMCCIHIAISGSFVIFPAYVSKLFGPEYGGTIYGMVFSHMLLGGPVTAILAHQLIGVIGFTGMFFMLSAFTALSLALTIPFREEIYIRKETKKLPVAINTRK